MLLYNATAQRIIATQRYLTEDAEEVGLNCDSREWIAWMLSPPAK